jgi:hypothetical protein
MFRALSTVLARSPYHDHVPARILATDQEAFVSLIANDPDFSMKQTDIGEATGYGQSRVSDLKKAKRHLSMVEAAHAAWRQSRCERGVNQDEKRGLEIVTLGELGPLVE